MLHGTIEQVLATLETLLFTKETLPGTLKRPHGTLEIFVTRELVGNKDMLKEWKC